MVRERVAAYLGLLTAGSFITVIDSCGSRLGDQQAATVPNAFDSA